MGGISRGSDVGIEQRTGGDLGSTPGFVSAEMYVGVGMGGTGCSTKERSDNGGMSAYPSGNGRY